ncbi:hypothetical protein AU381_25665 [Sinorhizobium glycinis]|uniref:Uncharacterized protein n=1 Tax=Sinorhizobium glycinis TaxID=1472378 RepID=A0A178XIT7_9HYPH|nr:hypothetical protein [Sinorhizobium glycinis]OAP35147.1 hypothetical protein AU381_25665 [Sinorhizobium glycinis]
MGAHHRCLPISPEELNDLQAVLEDVLQELKLSRESEEAEAVARRLIQLYESGVRDAASLHTVLTTPDGQT